MTNVNKTYGKQLRKLARYIEESGLFYTGNGKGYIYLPKRGVYITEHSNNTEQHKKGMLYVTYDNEGYIMPLSDVTLLIDKVQEGTLV